MMMRGPGRRCQRRIQERRLVRSRTMMLLLMAAAAAGLLVLPHVVVVDAGQPKTPVAVEPPTTTLVSITQKPALESAHAPSPRPALESAHAPSPRPAITPPPIKKTLPTNTTDAPAPSYYPPGVAPTKPPLPPSMTYEPTSVTTEAPTTYTKSPAATTTPTSSSVPTPSYYYEDEEVSILPLPAIYFPAYIKFGFDWSRAAAAVSRAVHAFLHAFFRATYPDQHVGIISGGVTTFLTTTDGEQVPEDSGGGGDNNNNTISIFVNATVTGGVVFRGQPIPTAEELWAALFDYLSGTEGAAALADAVISSDDEDDGTGLVEISGDDIALLPAPIPEEPSSSSWILVKFPSISFIVAVAGNATATISAKVAERVDNFLQKFWSDTYPDNYVGTTNVETNVEYDTTNTTTIINATTSGAGGVLFSRRPPNPAAFLAALADFLKGSAAALVDLFTGDDDDAGITVTEIAVVVGGFTIYGDVAAIVGTVSPTTAPATTNTTTTAMPTASPVVSTPSVPSWSVYVLIPLPTIKFGGTAAIEGTSAIDEDAVSLRVEQLIQAFLLPKYPNSYYGTTNVGTTIDYNETIIEATTGGEALFQRADDGTVVPSADQLRADLAEYLASAAGVVALAELISVGITVTGDVTVSPATGLPAASTEVSILSWPSLTLIATTAATPATPLTEDFVGGRVEEVVQTFLQSTYPGTFIGTTNVVTVLTVVSETKFNSTTTGGAVFTAGGPMAEELRTDLAEYLVNDGGDEVLEESLSSGGDVYVIDNITLDDVSVAEIVSGGGEVAADDDDEEEGDGRRFKRITRIIIGTVVGGIVGLLLCCCCGFYLFYYVCCQSSSGGDGDAVVVRPGEEVAENPPPPGTAA